MSDFGSPVAQNVNPSQGLQTLSAVLGLKSKQIGIQQQQQDLQTGQATQASAEAAATVAQQGAKENQNLAKLISDPVGNGIANPDGTPTDQAKNLYMQAAPTTWGQHYDNLVATAARKVEFNQKVNDLNSSERAELSSTVAGAASGAQSPDDVKSALSSLIETKKGTPVYSDYQRMGQLVSDQLAHVQDASKGKNPAPAGQEPWRTAALNIGRSVLPASGTVGAGGIAAPGNVQVDTGPTVQPGTVAPALRGGAFTAGGPPVVKAPGPTQTIPYVADAARAATQGSGTGNADVDRANEVGAAQKMASTAIPLTQRIDQLADAVNSGHVAKILSEGGNYLGFSNMNQVRSELIKDLGMVRGVAAAHAGSDSRASEILSGYPTDTTPAETTHQAMDYIRGAARMDLARGKVLNNYQSSTTGVKGFQAADNVLTATTNPIVHEYLSLPKEQQLPFLKRNAATPQQAQAIRDQALAAQKHTSVLQ